MNDGDGPGPLDDLRVVELSQGIAAPSCARYLAAQGAEVIKLESPHKPDITRLYSAGWLPGDVEPEVRPDTSPLVDEFLSGKLSFGVNLAADKGHELVFDLIARSDIFLVNLSVHALRSLRFTYDDVRHARPDIVYASLPGFGNGASRYNGYRAWGPNQAPLAGIDHLTGWPDRPPSGISAFAYPDYVNANHATIAILTALLERDRTGEGQFVDMSQFESTVAILGPIIMDFTANNRDTGRRGNRSLSSSPHGVYPARGWDRWVAIACRTNEEWDALCTVAAEEPWVADPRWADAAGRLSEADELDKEIASWTASTTARDLVYRLQDAGVPAGMVQDNPALLTDPQLEARRFFVVAPQSRFGKGIFMNFPPKMSATPPEFRRAGAAVGEDNDYVLDSILGLSDGAQKALIEAGVVYPMPFSETTFKRPYVDWVSQLMPTEEWS